MKKYHSRQNAPKLFREETSVTCATRSKFWREGNELEKVQLIENKFPFSEIDINDKFDLQMAEFALKILKKNKSFSKNILMKNLPLAVFAYNRPSHLKRLLISLESNKVKFFNFFLDGPKIKKTN